MSWTASLTGLSLAVAGAGGATAMRNGAFAAAGPETTAASVQEGRTVRGWLSWRGPRQDGTSLETGLLDTVTLDGENHQWSYALAGRGTPVIANGRVFALGYEGEGADLQELLVCLDERSGELVWERRWNDFLSDSIYSRYAIGSPTVDPESGDVFVLSTAGLLMGFGPRGEERWQCSLMEEFGRLTFPNGRTGSPVVDGELVIVHAITSHWGPQGPASDRFYAFDKTSGSHVWTSTPGVRPVDSSFSMPVFEWRDGRRLLYATTGCGNVVCIDAGSGDPLWRFQLASGGLNSAAVLRGDELIAVNGKENADDSIIGRMVALKLGAGPGAGESGPVVLDASSELWRNDLVAFTSSPVLVGQRVYQTTAEGNLCCVDAESGAVLWRAKLAPDQIHASPAWADGKLYVPMNNGTFHVIRPSDEGARTLCTVQLEGNCLGAPAICNGRVYVHTTAKLYCFGTGADGVVEEAPRYSEPEPGAAARVQIVPGDVLLRAGERMPIDVRLLDAQGGLVARASDGVAWSEWPGVAVDAGVLSVSRDAPPRVGVLTVTAGGLKGSTRLRIVPNPPFAEDFEGISLSERHAAEEGVPFAHPPSQWIGARGKWEVRELDGGKVLAKTLDNPLFQRALGFIGHPGESGYTMRADVRSDGNRRTMSSAGVVNQRYLIQLKGNHQQLEVSSNDERIKEAVPFEWRPGVWYSLETRVDVAGDGSGVVRAKAWPRDEAEPEEWTIEVPHRRAHTHGSPGLFGFAPQSRFRVYIDNVSVTPNE